VVHDPPGATRAAIGNRYSPPIVTALHWRDGAKRNRRRRSRAFDVRRPRYPRDELRALHQLRLQRDVVEIEPAWPCRRSALRIDGDDLEVDALAQTQEGVVRAHWKMLAAGLRGCARCAGDELDAVGERCRREEEVVELRRRRIRPPHFGHRVSSLPKSISKRAPFRAW